MKTMRSFILFLVGMAVAVTAITVYAQPVEAQNQCFDDQGLPIPCQPPPGQSTCGGPNDPPCPVDPNKEEKQKATKVPTNTPMPTLTDTPTATSTPTPTSTSTSTATSVPTATAIPIIVGSSGSNNPNSELPAVQNPDQGSSPFNFPGPFGTISVVLLILIGLTVGLFIALRRKRIGDKGDELLPNLERNSSENATVTVPGFGDLGHENVTITVRSFDDLGNENKTVSIQDVNDISPDVIRDAREAASDPGGIQRNANPGGVQFGSNPGGVQQPPSPNKGDKSGGGM